MGHVQHFDANGNKTPSVSEIPGIFHRNMDGFEDWICKGLHTKDEKCCTKAKRAFYTESADLGNDIHNLREAFLRGQPFSDGVPEYQAHVFEPVARFYKESGYKPITVESIQGAGLELGVELKMTGKEFGGTLDGAGRFAVPFWEKQRKTFWDKHSAEHMELGGVTDGDLPSVDDVWIEDLKVKSKIDILHPLQLYGYSLLLKEVYGIEAKWGLIIRREKKLDKTPEIQLKGYYLPAYKTQWDAAMVCWRFLNA